MSEEFPDVLGRVTGRGAMLGLGLKHEAPASRMMRELLRVAGGYWCSSYLLHHHDIRILPTLGRPRFSALNLRVFHD
ncbi:MAG: hypothetical protein R3B96_16220 [Pirellulaceae bacterium]